MIIEGLLNFLIEIFDLVLMPIQLPSFPTEAMVYLDTFFDYMVMGAGVVANYTPFSYLMLLFGLIITVDIGIAIYHLVMWIIRKFPISSE